MTWQDGYEDIIVCNRPENPVPDIPVSNRPRRPASASANLAISTSGAVPLDVGAPVLDRLFGF